MFGIATSKTRSVYERPPRWPFAIDLSDRRGDALRYCIPLGWPGAYEVRPLYNRNVIGFRGIPPSLGGSGAIFDAHAPNTTTHESDFSADTAINPVLFSAFTVCVWVVRTGSQAFNGPFGGGANNSMGAHWSNGQGILYYQANGAGAYGYNGASVLGAIGVPFHWVKAFDSGGATDSDKLKAYVDGLNVALTYSGTIGQVTSSSRFYAGSYSGSAFPGTWGDFRIYDAQLSADDVSHIASPGTRWNLYEPYGVCTYFIPEAAAGGGFQAAWAANSTVTIQGGVQA